LFRDAPIGHRLAEMQPVAVDQGDQLGREETMTAKSLFPAVAFALCCFAASTGYGANGDAADPGRPREFSAATLARVTPGKTTQTQVEALLGKPWRTIFADDADEPGPIVWEYHGQDVNGGYLVHIEFDSHDVTTLIAKIPEQTQEAPARVAKTPALPGKP
jgi:outer membrane protein assembly factor BamE (lipoprotein component of BamABCDE complex)